MQNKVWLHGSASFSIISSLAQEVAAWCSIIEAGGAVQGNVVEIVIFGAGGFAREVEWLIADKMCTLPPSWPALQVGAMKSVMRYMALPC